ncbi:MAG TPA: sulfotransferase [Kiritimatiellia bacterium]|nr:sulfotransferase [Kiritimatiellia bacterium]
MSSHTGNIFVVGMHRSGTSALSGLLVKMGAYFGPEDKQLPAEKANPKGYWERWDVITGNDLLLADYKLEWHRVSEYRPLQFENTPLERVREVLGSMVEDYNLNQPWFVKDPRICLTLPCWRKLVENPVCVLVVRDPLQVAHSLESRGDCSIHTGLGLWECYTGAAFWNTRDCPRIILHYENVLREPEAELTRMLEFFNRNGVSGLCVPDKSTIQSWIDSNLQREQVRVDSTIDVLNSRQKELHLAILDGTALTWKTPWKISNGGLMALKSFEKQYLTLLNEKNNLVIRNAHLESEIEFVRVFKRDILAWNRDLEHCANVLADSATYKWSRRLLKTWCKITGRAEPSSPYDRLRDIITAQKNIEGLEAPGENSDQK